MLDLLVHKKFILSKIHCSLSFSVYLIHIMRKFSEQPLKFLFYTWAYEATFYRMRPMVYQTLTGGSCQRSPVEVISHDLPYSFNHEILGFKPVIFHISCRCSATEPWLFTYSLWSLSCQVTFTGKSTSQIRFTPVIYVMLLVFLKRCRKTKGSKRSPCPKEPLL